MRQNQTAAIGVMHLVAGIRSGFAISLDVLDVANRAAEATGVSSPFSPVVLRPGDGLPSGLTVLVLPGMGCATVAEIDAVLGSDEGRWAVGIVREAASTGVHIATSCAGVFVAAAAGVLDGRVATTSWFLEAELARRHPTITVNGDCVLVESGPCLTGGAAMAHADVMLAVVDRFAGTDLADICARYLLLDRRRSQRPYMVLAALIRSDAQLVAAEAWVRQHIAEPFYVADVAAAVGLGARTFARRLRRACGMTPVQFVQRIRVDVARALLARGQTFEAVAPEVGYGDATALRRVFRQHGRR